MRGSQTPPELAEKARAIVATTGNYSEAERRLGIPDSTIHNLVKNDDEFGKYREQVQREYILKTWNNILAIEEILVDKIKTLRPNTLQLREITGALKDLKQTVENVVNNVNVAVQVNNNTSPEELEKAVTLYLDNNPDFIKRYVEGK